MARVSSQTTGLQLVSLPQVWEHILGKLKGWPVETACVLLCGIISPSSQGRSHLGVVVVPARATFRVWKGRSCFGEMPAKAGRMTMAGL